MVWRIIFSKTFGIAALLLSMLNLGVTNHGFELHSFIDRLTDKWVEITRWMLSFLDYVSFFKIWCYEDHEKDMTAAQIAALSPAIYYAKNVNIRLSICGIIYILVYALIFGTSLPSGPDSSDFQGIYRVLALLFFASFMFLLLSDKYRIRGDVSFKEIAWLIARIWENAIAVFILIMLLSFTGLITVVDTATK